MLYVPDDEPVWNEEYKVLTRQQLNIPALHMMGHANFHSTSKKLDNHFHCNMEFVVVINGRQQYQIDRHLYMLHGGDIFVSYPYEHHGNGNIHQEVCEFIWFQFDFSSSENFLGLTPPYSEYIYQQLLNYRQRTKKTGKKELNILTNSFQLLSSDAFYDKVLGYSYFLNFVIHNLCDKEKLPKDDIYSPDIQESMTYIHSHLTEPLSLDDIAGHCGLSPSRFKAKFREQLGITPHAYITSLKIDTAKILLKNPTYTITDVAFQLNYSSSNHFSSVFKKHTGYTPAEFRQQHVHTVY